MLQQHCEGFESMLSKEDSTDNPIVLDDPLESFQEFYNVMFTYVMFLFSSFSKTRHSTRQAARLTHALNAVLLHLVS